MVSTTSTPAAASAALLAATAPALTTASRLGFTTSNARSVWPALSRLRAIGPPILPRPMKPIVAMASSSVVVVELGFARERREIGIDFRRRRLRKRGRAPFRCVVLVDEHGAHAFEEIGVGHEPPHQPILHAHAVLEVEMRRLAQLAQGHAQAERRLLRQGLARLRGPRRPFAF